MSKKISAEIRHQVLVLLRQGARAQSIATQLRLRRGVSINDRWGPKWVIGTGGIALLVGYVLASFAKSLTILSVAYGVFVGIGTGLVNGCTMKA